MSDKTDRSNSPSSGSQSLDAIHRAGRELVTLDVPAETDPQQLRSQLTERIVDCARVACGYRHFTVMRLDETDGSLAVLLSEGDRAGLGADEICDRVIGTGRSCITAGVANTSGRLTVPLRLGEKVTGVLDIISDSPPLLTDQDQARAELFAGYIAVALHILDMLGCQRYAAHRQFSGSISADLAGPINDIATEAGELMDDYAGTDDLRKRLASIVDRAGDARRIVRALAESPVAGALAGDASRAERDDVLAGKRVLVADDEPVMRETIRDVLTAAGCKVDSAAEGGEAVEMVSGATYDLVISDIKMPGATGYEVFAAARSGNETTPVILITGFGYDPHHSIVMANSEGLSAVLMKPFKAHKLLAECRAALAR